MDGAPDQKTRAREIGARVAQARREAGGMTQAELAELLRISPRTVQAYEQGEIIPYKNLRSLENFLDRPAAWFLHGDDAIQARDAKHDEVMGSLRELHRKVDELLSHRP